MLSEFVNWANQLGTAFEQDAARIKVTLGEVGSNTSARLDIDTADKIGRITFWESGDFHAEILAYDSGELLYSSHGGAMDAGSLTQCFDRFFSYFRPWRVSNMLDQELIGELDNAIDAIGGIRRLPDMEANFCIQLLLTNCNDPP